MRKNTVILGSVCSVMLITAFLVWRAEDRAGPEIIFKGAIPIYRQGMDKEELLSGVYAEDARDGDVSSSLIIETIYQTGDKKQVIVVYTAKDSQNHVTKKMRTLSCLEEETHDYQIQETDLTPESENDNVLNNVGQDQSGLLEASDQQRPRLYLTTDEVTLQYEEPFNSLQYIDKIEDDTDSKEELWTRIQVNGIVDSRSAGTYAVEYLVTDSEGNQSDTAVLIVHVAETT